MNHVIFTEYNNSTSTIKPYLEFLFMLTNKVEYITEITSFSSDATLAFLLANKTLTAYSKLFDDDILTLLEYSKKQQYNVEYTVVDDLTNINIPKTDLLFLNINSEYDETLRVLKRYQNAVGRYIVINNIRNIDTILAVTEFISDSTWTIKKQFVANEGLLLLSQTKSI